MSEAHVVGPSSLGRSGGFGASEPDPVDCRGPSDVGKIHHDDERDIWYECVFDEHKPVYTWTILPRGADRAASSVGDEEQGEAVRT
jgi:hypothetical protein